MSNRTTHVLIGLFVIGGCLLLAAFLIVLGTSDLGVVDAETVMEEPVTGLSKGAPVRYFGVDIGEVKEVFLARDSPPNGRPLVGVRFSCSDIGRGNVDDETEVRRRLERMVAAGLRASLMSPGIGISGQVYLALEFFEDADQKYPPIARDRATAGGDYLYVPSVPSRIARFSVAVEEILEDLRQADVSGLVEEAKKTLGNVSETLAGAGVSELKENVRRLLSRGESVLDRLDQELPALVRSAQQAADRIGGAAASVEGRVQDPRIDRILAHIEGGATELERFLKEADWDVLASNLEEMSREAKETFASARKVLVDVESAVTELHRVIKGRGGDVEATLAGLHRITDRLEGLSRTLERYPSVLLFGKPPERRAPGR